MVTAAMVAAIRIVVIATVVVADSGSGVTLARRMDRGAIRATAQRTGVRERKQGNYQ